MKILKLRFKNLNSLFGEWEIDLTNPAFTSDGIFAITGSTGAGKTTILDAICLALYGRTPRLDRVNKSGNDVMSRQTGECFAEVTFQNQRGSYLCHWGQHRSRKKADGKLQEPKHEISEVNTGRLLESQLRKVSQKIEEVTGMDFDRFTRSMLLAQGGFAAFLSADPDERAPILEQITGTEIYSQISIGVHDRRSKENKKFEMLNEKLSGMQPLNEEEEQKLKSEHKQKSVEATSIEKQVKEKQTAISWLNEIEKLEKELVSIKEEEANLSSRTEAFQPQLKLLERAKQALEFSGDHGALGEIRKAQNNEIKALEELKSKLPELEAKAKEGVKLLTRVSEGLFGRKTALKEGLQTINKVRELDLKQNENEKRIKELQETVFKLQNEFKESQNIKTKKCKYLENFRGELAKIEDFLSKNKADESLVENLAGIKEQFSTYRLVANKRKDHIKAIIEAEKQEKEAKDCWNNSKEKQEGLKKECDVQETSFENLQKALKNRLEGKESSYLHKELSGLKDRKTIIIQIDKTLNEIADLQTVQSSLVDRLEVLKKRGDKLSVVEIEKTHGQSNLEKEIQQLEAKLVHLNSIKDLEKTRHDLEDGKPCPLCGAEDHPFSLGNVPKPDESRIALEEKKKALQVVRKELSDIVTEKAGTSREGELLAEKHKNQVLQLEALNSRLSEDLASIEVALSEQENQATEIKGLVDDVDDKFRKLSEQITEAEKLEKGLNEKRTAFESAKKNLALEEIVLQKNAFKKGSLEIELKRLRKELESFEEQFSRNQKTALDSLKPYGIKTLQIEDLDSVSEQLTEKCSQWKDSQKNKTEVDKKVSNLVLLKEQLVDQISKQEAGLKERKQKLNEHVQERDDLSEQRKKLFDDKNPDDEQTMLLESVENAENDLQNARESLTLINQELNGLKTSIKNKGKSVEKRSLELKEKEDAFTSLLDKSQFVDEEDFVKACLKEDDRKVLEEKKIHLKEEKTKLETSRKERVLKLDVEKKKQLTGKTIDELTSESNALSANLKELQQHIGRIEQQLEDNTKLHLEMQEQIKTLEAQKKEFSRWDILHNLIGSNDGKKYRIFAQGLTFEMMIGHANRQLQKMTDRYLLIKDSDQPLELNVVDNYQAGEIRTTKNLSGGESFIISLSLALGLSSMASKNVRVDSLFLDEGFGSLDEDALDIALDTLAGLQQDCKLIGVISHVPTLKERISSQIQVVSCSGGRSKIYGPGCKSIVN